VRILDATAIAGEAALLRTRGNRSEALIAAWGGVGRKLRLLKITPSLIDVSTLFLAILRTKTPSKPLGNKASDGVNTSVENH
jgi:hypothetical protein